MISVFPFNPVCLQGQHPGVRRYVTQAVMVALALTLAGSSVHAELEASVLLVDAIGFRNNTGHAIAKLFVPGDDVLKRGHKEVGSSISNGRATFIFSSVPSGEYAMVVFHDVNDNGIVDHNFIGFPKEALGFSNGFSLGLGSGLPNFEKLRFIHDSARQTIIIKVE